jgi:hypothetical protein
VIVARDARRDIEHHWPALSLRALAAPRCASIIEERE